RLNCARTLSPGIFDHSYIFGIWSLRADFDKATPHLLHDELVAEGLYRVELAVMPGSLNELQHQHAHTVSNCAQRRAHRCGRFALTGTGINDDETATHVSHKQSFDCTEREQNLVIG